MKLQRTIDSMIPAAAARARHLWHSFNEEYCDESLNARYGTREFERARDEYYAIFKDDRNFLPDTEPYQEVE